jgi:predicted O-methyltransferase YrrM
VNDLHRFIAMTAVTRYNALQKPEELVWLLDEIYYDEIRIVIEIGCDAGGTLYMWRRIAPTVLGIDLPQGPFSSGRPLVSHGATMILADSHDLRTLTAARGFLLSEEADLLFLDGDHTLPGVTQDYEMYQQLIRPGGLIVLQDIRDHHRDDVGVHLLWQAIKEDHPKATKEFMHGPDDWGGIGVLRKPSEREVVGAELSPSYPRE